MCTRLQDTANPAVGLYQKGNEPEPLVMPILVVPCECGKTFWAKVPNGQVFVECEGVV